MKPIVTIVMATNVAACSMLAKRHQRCQRAEVGLVGLELVAAAVGAASSSPVIGLTRRGT